MKRFAIYLLLVVFIVSCTSQNHKKEISSNTVQVLATTGMIADLVEKIVGDKIEVTLLIPSALDPHSYELVKGDDEKFTNATLIFYNGLGLEHGISLRRQLLHHQAKAICVTQKILEETPSALLQTEGVYDPHVWMDISLWSRVIPPIYEALVVTFPEFKDYFLERKEELLQTMLAQDAATFEKIQAIASDRRFLVTSHDAFQYFTRRYLANPGEEEWQKRATAPEGLAPEAELSTVDLMKVLSYIEEHQTKVLFTESNLPTRGISKLLESGLKKGISLRLAKHALYADSMGEADSYLAMIQHNVDVIAEELMHDQ